MMATPDIASTDAGTRKPPHGAAALLLVLAAVTVFLAAGELLATSAPSFTDQHLTPLEVASYSFAVLLAALRNVIHLGALVFSAAVIIELLDQIVWRLSDEADRAARAPRYVLARLGRVRFLRWWTDPAFRAGGET